MVEIVNGTLHKKSYKLKSRPGTGSYDSSKKIHYLSTNKAQKESTGSLMFMIPRTSASEENV